MTRDETVALFLECEAKRKEAHAAALAAGKFGDEARAMAHEEAKRHWNEWAEPLLAERKAMEADGRWDASEADWFERAETDFSFCLFLNKFRVKEAELKAAIEKRATEGSCDPKSISVEAEATRFDDFVFPGRARFYRAAFSDDASFDRVAFSDDAWFDSADFLGRASFDSAVFSGNAWFDHAAFSGNASFGSVAFSGDASFVSTTFSCYASFNEAKFRRYTAFTKVGFSSDTRFAGTTFEGYASFGNATFSGDTCFDSAIFIEDTQFRGLTFPRDIFFRNAKFGPGRADFSLATFERVVQFDGASFTGEANFNAVSVKRTFSMSGAKFERPPNFIQAHFDEAPRLDNVVVTPPKNSERLSADKALDLFARWRELKRLAIQAHDTDRALEFNAQEIRAERAASGWPIPDEAYGWKIWLRSFFGGLYGFFSDYGRSLFWPFLWWIVAIAISAAFYLSQTEAMQTGRYAMWQSVPCYPAPTSPAPIYAETWRHNWKMWEKPKAGAASSHETTAFNSNQTTVGGLSEKLRVQTNARAEALHLAFRNAFVVLDGGSDASHRMYAGQNPVPIVPSAVSTASAIQKLISGVLIFLFGLALRNMLKVK